MIPIALGFLLMMFTIDAQSTKPEFPKGCISEGENFEKVCQFLESVGPEDVLVFSSGEKMSGCLLQTKSADSHAANNNFALLEMGFSGLLFEVDPKLSEIDHLDYLKEPLKLLKYNLTDNQRKAVELFAEQVKARQNRKAKLIMDSRPLKVRQVENVKKLTQGIVRNAFPPSISNVLIERIGEIKETEGSDLTENKSDTLVSCAPNVNAFFSFETRKDSQSQAIINKSAVRYPNLSKIFMLAHEIAHSFDPCLSGKSSPKELRQIDAGEMSAAEGFGDLIGCLRDELDFKSKAFKGNGCSDQVTNEAFCDYIASEILSWFAKDEIGKTEEYPEMGADEIKIPKGYEAIFFSLDAGCSERDKEKNTTHPASKKRLFDIILKNPVLARVIGCPAPQKTCDIYSGFLGERMPQKKEPVAPPSQQK